MSDKTELPHTSEDGATNAKAKTVKRKVNTNIIVIKDELSINSKSDSVLMEVIDLDPTRNNETQNESDQYQPLANTAKIMDKEEQDESKNDVGAYLRTEFTNPYTHECKDIHETTDKLPKYKEIDIIGKRNFFIKKPKRRRTKAYSNGLVMVQMFMGSEKVPENKVVMEYDPEAYNGTVKGMFVNVFFLHFFCGCLTLGSFISPAREGTILYGHLIALPSLLVLWILVTCSACFQMCRSTCCSCFAGFLAVILLSLFYSGICGYFSKRIFIFHTVAITCTDIAFIIMAGKLNDFTNKVLYVIGVALSISFLLVFMPPMEFWFTSNAYYWGDFPPDNMLSYGLCFIYTALVMAAQVAELHLLLAGEFVEMAENDYLFGGYLMFIAFLDFPIRYMRKRGWLDSCDSGGGDEEE